MSNIYIENELKNNTNLLLNKNQENEVSIQSQLPSDLNA
jgi:hypothetical protein